MSVAAIVVAAGCERGVRPQPAAPIAALEAPARPFSPGHASTARRAQIKAVAPALDRLFESKLGQA